MIENYLTPEAGEIRFRYKVTLISLLAFLPLIATYFYLRRNDPTEVLYLAMIGWVCVGLYAVCIIFGFLLATTLK